LKREQNVIVTQVLIHTSNHVAFVILTGASGYLGGSLLAQLARTTLPPHATLYTLVRSQQQAEAVKKYGAEPLLLDLHDQDALSKTIVEKSISIIFFLVDAMKSELQVPMIKALGEVKKKTGMEVHFLHTSGPKLFSEDVAFTTNREVKVSEDGMWEMQNNARSSITVMNEVWRGDLDT
jgi:hypothetical protein